MIYFIALTLSIQSLCSDCLSAPLLKILDGDTIVVSLNDKKTKVRLYGIDAPEGNQKYGRESTQALQLFLASYKTVSIKTITKDRHKRIVGVVFAEGRNINEAMVAGGWAWMFRKYCDLPFCNEWKQIEGQARQARLGLWQDPNPLPPWEWRKTCAVAPEEVGKYRTNVKSGVFHRSSCPAFCCKHCTLLFDDRQQAIDAGFKPCGVCKP